MKLRFPRIPPDGSWFPDYEIERVKVRVKIIRELREKYAEELRMASWWKRWLIAFRIGREADRIFRHRLYLSSTAKGTGS